MQEVEEGKQGLYYVLTDLMLSSLLALIYTNDLFTAYVFVEINTISACGLIMIRQNGRTIEAAVRYMIMSLLGSGLFLVGICMLYDLTGASADVQYSGRNWPDSGGGPIGRRCYLRLRLFRWGWLLKAPCSPSCLASGCLWVFHGFFGRRFVQPGIKGYIFLLFKIIYRVIGFDVFRQ